MLELWNARKPVVIFVTHDFSEALTVSDRIIFFSAHPGTPVLEIPVSLKRPRDSETEVRNLQEDLLQRYPDILSGTQQPVVATDGSGCATGTI